MILFSQYAFLFTIALFFWCVGNLDISIVRDPMKKALYLFISGVLFFILVIESLNISDTNGVNWAQNGVDFWIPLLMSLLLALISFISFFIILVPMWNKNFKGAKF